MTIKANGGSASFDGKHALLFSDITNLRFNNSIPVGNKAITPEVKVPTITSSVASTDTGAYTITASIPAQSNATSYSLYEDNQVVKTGAVTETAQIVTFDVKDKAIGTYTYKITLTNGTDVAENTVIVKVVKADELATAIVSLSETSTNADAYKVYISVPANSKATNYTLYEGSSAIAQGVVTKQAQSIVKEFLDKANGIYTYKVELINATGSKFSNETTVTVR